MTTGEKIRAARKRQGMTQKQLGERSGIAEPTIRKYELGKLNPKRETLAKISRALGVTVLYFMDDPNFSSLDDSLNEYSRHVDEFKVGKNNRIYIRFNLRKKT